MKLRIPNDGETDIFILPEEIIIIIFNFIPFENLSNVRIRKVCKLFYFTYVKRQRLLISDYINKLLKTNVMKHSYEDMNWLQMTAILIQFTNDRKMVNFL